MRRPLPALVSITFLVFAVFAAGEENSKSDHWSLKPCRQPNVPSFDDTAVRTRVRNPIDAFILDRLVREGLRPSAEADRRTLIRRVTFDLTGLPPTPAEVEAFVNDRASDAYERLVDRLLESPRYGERWGRHWLDVVRFAESEGFEYDRPRAGAWRFRDYVIDSFNRDKPYDQFVMEQLAGDELVRDEIAPENHELLVAAGFHRLGAVRRNAGNQELAFSRNEVLTEMTDIVGAAFLGLTVGCARCHDHMFDDIPQADYYRLQAFLAATHEHNVSLASAEDEAAWKEETERIQKEIKRLKKEMDEKTGAERDALEQQVEELQQTLPQPPATISSVHNVPAERTPIHILNRGNTEKKERQVGPRVLSALASADAPELPADVADPRTTLARWIVDPANPLTARVLVNRVWQRHFGTGLVKTANDFGLNGSLPSHPELLDWLASDFVAGGWRIKRMQRLIVTSATYRQAGAGGWGSGAGENEARARRAGEVDPENRLLSYFPRRRLTAEELRDAMLAVSGRLNNRVGGPSVMLPVDADLVNLLYAPAQWQVTKDGSEHDRRSVYLVSKRNLRLPFMEAFDQPDAQISCAHRESSTHALQALELLNGRLSNELAESFAQRLHHEAGSDTGKQAEMAYQLAAGRAPTAKEKQIAVDFLRRQSLKEFALAVFNLTAFLYVQ
jgi:hypothetical protein